MAKVSSVPPQQSVVRYTRGWQAPSDVVAMLKT
jgi:hypothetical protein